MALDRDAEWQDRVEALRLKRADERAALRQWWDGLHASEMDDGAILFEKLADVMSPVFEYLARGGTERSLALRAWCVLYAVCPERIGYETMQTVADRFGCTLQNVAYQLRVFEAAVPGYRHASSSRRGCSVSNEVTRSRLERARAVYHGAGAVE